MEFFAVGMADKQAIDVIKDGDDLFAFGELLLTPLAERWAKH